MAEGEKAAMKRRKWDPKEKAMILLHGLKNRPLAEICS
jgi:hypothetical protein